MARGLKTYLAPHLLLLTAHQGMLRTLMIPTISSKEPWALESRVAFPINEAGDDTSEIFAADAEDEKDDETGEEGKEVFDVWGSDT